MEFDRSQFFVTNAVKCRPEGNRTPTDREIATCVSSYLHRELELIKPKYGLALGNSGLKATLGRTGITKHNGTSYEAYGTTWIAAFHPAAILRNPSLASQFHAALLVFARLVRDADGIPQTEAVLVNDPDSLRALVAELEKPYAVAALDTETYGEKPAHGSFKGGGLAWWDASTKIVSIQFTFRPGKAWVLLLNHKNSRWKNPYAVVQKIKPYIEGFSGHWIMQNGKYDEHILASVGIRVRQSHDTMGMAYAMDENNRKDLGYLSQVYLGAAQYKDMLDKSKMYYSNLDDLVTYAGTDTDMTRRLYKPLTVRLSEDGLSKRLYDKLLMPAVNVLTHVEAAGVPINPGKFEKRRELCNARIMREIKKLEKFNRGPINPNSPAQIGDLLYNRMGLPVIMRTKTGAASTAEGVLIRLKDYDETGVMDVVMEYRRWAGYGSRYFNSWDYFMDHKWRIHPNFKPFHTVTGRLSCDNPNMQQVARDPFIRGMVGGRKGWSIVEADYSQAELRIAAHLSQDKTMIRAFNLGRDIHMETAMATLGLTEKEVSAEQRKKAKAVNFGFLYGMGYTKFMAYAKENYELDVSQGEAKEVRERYFQTFRSLRAWHERQRKAARRRKWVVSPIGRKRRLWDIDSEQESIRQEAERQAINSPVQSMASDMNLLAMVLIHPQLDPNEARIIATVHDSILFEIRDECVDYYAPLILETMENLPLEELFECRLTVPIVADIKVGKHWSEGAEPYAR